MPKKYWPALRERSESKGYTLIELLIVTSIMGILSIVVFVNFRDFSQDQVLNNAALEIQSLIRLAQSNATSAIICAGSGGVSWAVKFRSDKAKLDLTCGPSGTVQKTLTLDNIQVSSIQCAPTSFTCPPGGVKFDPPLTVSFSPLYGNVTFVEGDSCVANASTLMIVLRNLKNNSYKCFTISKGGAIDVK